MEEGKKTIEPMRWGAEQLKHVVAQVMQYGADHYDEEWRAVPDSRFKSAMEAISMVVACLLAQNTTKGHDGIDWDVVYGDLIKSTWNDPYQKWYEIAARLVDELEPSASVQSIIYWPSNIYIGSADNTSREWHISRTLAEQVCQRATLEGYGNFGKVFPIRYEIVGH